jgi:putative Mg2+ transporter-C (MgtC) family protein
MPYTDFTLRLLAALAAGLIIGMEREWQNKPAGLRTNTLVAVGSALFVLLAYNIMLTSGTVIDVTRIIGQVVTGIGFLGAGIIFKQGTDIHGLTTAATVWCSAAIGCLAGAGYFVETLIGVVVIVLVNIALIPVDKYMERSARKKKEGEKGREGEA